MRMSAYAGVMGAEGFESAAEVPCTADADLLFNPPCACPACAPPEVTEASGPTAIWLPIGGRPVRREICNMELGDAGHRVLG